MRKAGKTNPETQYKDKTNKTVVYSCRMKNQYPQIVLLDMVEGNNSCQGLENYCLRR